MVTCLFIIWFMVLAFIGFAAVLTFIFSAIMAFFAML